MWGGADPSGGGSIIALARQRGAWHRLRRCSRLKPLPQVLRCSAGRRCTCGSGRAREAGDVVYGTGWAGVRGRGRSHRCSANAKPAQYLWERACPRSRRRGGWHRLCRCSRAPDASQLSNLGLLCSPSPASRAPTGTAQASRFPRYLWERACPRSRRRDGWHRLCRCSRACPDASQSSDLGPLCGPSLASQAPTGAAQASRLSRSLWEPGLPAMGCTAAPMTSGLSASAWAPPRRGNRPGSQSRNLHRPASHGPGTAWRNHR